MADHDEDELLSPLSEEERRRREQQRRRPTLDEEIVRKYDPARLKQLVAQGAGRGEKLDLQTRTEMARVLPGQDFSDVRVFGRYIDFL